MLQRCDYWLTRAKRGDDELYTSSLTLAEVVKRKCDGKPLEITPSDDAVFQSLFDQEWVFEINVDHAVGVRARQLSREFALKGKVLKPADAIHLASAVLYCDRMFTLDHSDLGSMNGQVRKVDGTLLEIGPPPSEFYEPLFAEPRAPASVEAKPSAPKSEEPGAELTVVEPTRPIKNREVDANASSKTASEVAAKSAADQIEAKPAIKQKPAKQLSPVGATAAVSGSSPKADVVDATSVAAK